MKVTEDTKAFARKTLKWIHKNPEVHDQSHFINGSLERLTDDGPACGTTMCIAGTVTYLKYGLSAAGKNHARVAANLLGLSYGEKQVLFFEMDDERALAKLEKIANGESFDRDDFATAHSQGESPEFNDIAWDERDHYDND